MPGRVLIIDDIATSRIMLKAKLTAAYYDVMQAASVDEVLPHLPKTLPDLILLGGPTSAPAQITQLRQHSAAPIVAILDHDTEDQRLAALRAGADDVLARGTDEVVLHARLRNLMRQALTDDELHHHTLTSHALGFAEPSTGFTGRAQITLIAQDRAAGQKLLSRLAPHTPHLFRLKSAAHTMGNAPGDSDAVPDLYMLLLDPDAPQEGLRLLAELRAPPRTRTIPVLALPGQQDSALTAQLLDLSAADVLEPTITPQEMGLRIAHQLERKSKRDQQQNRLQHGLKAAMTDPLTGLYNRRYALSYLSNLLERAGHEGEDFAVMIADLDHFKEVNDSFGHAAGDAVLRRVAAILHQQLGEDDLIARIGGEEFLIVLPGCDSYTAQRVARSLCRAVRTTPVTLPPGAGPAQVTISIGMAVGSASEDGGQDLLAQADQALYRSKSEGRNTVRIGQRNAA